MLRDIRHAVRMLLHSKGWTAVVVVSLALGIGANTAIFSAVNGMLLKKIPVREPDGLVRLKWTGRNDMVNNSSDYGFSAKDSLGRDVRSTFSYAMYLQFRSDNQTMSDLFACAPAGQVNFVVDGQAEIARSFVASGNYFQVLGIKAARGRLLTPEDDQPTAPPVAVISDSYWRTRFGSDPAAVGKAVRLNNAPVTIVGITPPEFTGVQQPLTENTADVTLPLAIDPQVQVNPDQRLKQPTNWWLQVMGRLKPGVTAAQVHANLESVFRHTARASMDAHLASLPDAERNNSGNRNRTNVPYLLVSSGNRGVYDVGTNETRAASILGIVVSLVLLIVCANVANLLLSRATARQKEISVRLSMGATRGRLIRQLLTESLLLAFIGGALGVVVGYWGKQLLPNPVGQAAMLDWRVMAFVVAVTTLTGVLFGIAPALSATRMNVSGVMKEISRSVSGGRSILSKSLLVVQVAISLVLLIGAGLFLRTLDNLREVDAGFNTRNLVLFRINAQLNRYDEKRILQLYQDLSQRLQTIGGVRAVTMTQPALLSGSVNMTSIVVQGRTYLEGQRQSINRVVVAPNFFETMEIPIILGRSFAERDNSQAAPKVVVINEAAARKYFPNENPIGQRFGQSVETSGQLEIVGVLRDAKYNSVREPAPPTMYVPILQTRTFGPFFAVRTAGEASTAIAAIRDAVRQVDASLPIIGMTTQSEQVELRFAQERIFAQAYALFGVLALVVAAIGLFGLMSYSVARRTNEMGIRVALGAQQQDVLRLVMSESMILVVAGVAIGVAAAWGASRYVESLLFGIAPTDESTMLLAIGLMIVVAGVAGYLPARRAARVDPVIALRYE